ncbi:RNA-binding domain-containing protein [Dentipellis sp. KUC8613]|nr:RNA-binding domain-containing protein [Dentipellis sp. KUC8613]
MEEGTKTKKTIFVGGIGEDVDEAVLLENFSTFGDIIDVQLPTAAANPSQPNETKHRGFAFVTFASSGDAQTAIDNMDLNELRGKVIKVSLARPNKGALQPSGNRPIWESEEWLKRYAKPLAESGGLQARKGEHDSKSPEGDQENAGEDEAMEE